MHVPVMLEEVLKYLSPKSGKTYVDCTFGRGGYSKAILDSGDIKLFSIDCDPSAKKFVEIFRKDIKDQSKFEFIEGNFGDIEVLLKKKNIEKVDGIVLDLGVSSVQLDQADRGFSFSKPAKLDMRMSQSGYSAYEFINESDEKTIADVIYKYGEENKAYKIASKIVKAREEGPIETTVQLAEIVRSVFYNKHSKIDNATKTFQAIRIFVNNELDNLESVLEASEKILNENGRLIVVSFHSLEDSIVKQFLKVRCQKSESSSRYLPDNDISEFKPKFSYLSKKAIKPSEKEVKNNIRSRSARMRAAIRVNVGGTGDA
ncbi:MAG: 16S rRNA (cytosine(1402)-N(4))-methyltransferase RsmH [Alphaproteobacteria bacterium]|nr:16S rRNA (cytosine(1402)-N(4))-methyltransferase RsmH [Alphaproteobacteria bacterium]